jgi:hypothetical protein
MNEHQLDHALEGFLDVGPQAAPEHVHSAIAADLGATGQVRHAWSGWSGSGDWRSAFSSVAVAVAAIVLVAVLGISLLNMGPVPLGGDHATPTATPKRSEGTPPPGATATPEVNWDSADYNRGRHRLEVDGIRFSFVTSTPGWEPYRTIHISKSEFGPQGAEGLVYWTAYPEGEDVWPCGPWFDEPETADLGELAHRVATAPGVEVVEAPSELLRELRFGGVQGRHLVVRVRENLGCDPGYFFSWRAKTGGALWQQANVGDTVWVWILNVDGAPFFVVAETNVEASEALTQEMLEIVSSIRFE